MQRLLLLSALVLLALDVAQATVLRKVGWDAKVVDRPADNGTRRRALLQQQYTDGSMCSLRYGSKIEVDIQASAGWYYAI